MIKSMLKVDVSEGISTSGFKNQNYQTNPFWKANRLLDGKVVQVVIFPRCDPLPFFEALDYASKFFKGGKSMNPIQKNTVR